MVRLGLGLGLELAIGLWLGLWLWLGLRVRVRVKVMVRVRFGFMVMVMVRVMVRIRVNLTLTLTLTKTLELNLNLLSYWDCCQNMVRKKNCPRRKVALQRDQNKYWNDKAETFPSFPFLSIIVHPSWVSQAPRVLSYCADALVFGS